MFGGELMNLHPKAVQYAVNQVMARDPETSLEEITKHYALIGLRIWDGLTTWSASMFEV